MLSAELLVRLARQGDVLAVRSLVGGRGGRTFAVDHAGGSTTVVHLRSHGADAIEREACATAAAHEAGAGPELVDVLPALGALVTRWVPGEVVAAQDFEDDGLVTAAAAVVARLHLGASAAVVGTVDPIGARERYVEEAGRRGVDWPAAVVQEQRRTTELARGISSTAAAHPQVLCHGDLVPANLVRGTAGVTVIDYEYAGRSEAAVDLGGLAAAAELADAAVLRLVDAYVATGGSADPSRVLAWRDVLRHAWFVWIALGDELGPERERWESWAARTQDRWDALA